MKRTVLVSTAPATMAPLTSKGGAPLTSKGGEKAPLAPL